MLIAILALVVGVPALWLTVEIQTAPFGYQDDLGFHAGVPTSVHNGPDTVSQVQHHGA